ncbi:MAG TPA: galactokinase family protein [Longimicrobiales bacterium]|jgi:galactokinase
MHRLADELRRAGMSDAAAGDKARLFDRAFGALCELTGGALPAETRAIWVPGRIEFLGKHTDYAGGRSLLCAVEHGICAAVSPRADRRLRVRDALAGETIEGELDPALEPPLGHWANYPLTVARRVARNFPGALRGADIAFASDLPPAAGMSSSSALIVATFLALSAVNDLPERDEYRREIRGPEDLAGYLGTVENGQSFGSLAGDRGVGTFGGSEDHTAILCARPRALVRYAFCPVRFEELLPLPPDHTFVIAVSGVRAEKTGGALEAYNRASLRAAALVQLWRRATGEDGTTLRGVLASSADAAARLRDLLCSTEVPGFSGQELRDRLEHFLAESEEIIPAAARALACRDLARLGELVDRSQELATRLLGNQVPETVTLARQARELGATAASAFGAGFGGSVWALVPASSAEEFRARWEHAYRESFPEAAREARFFQTDAGPAALVLDLPSGLVAGLRS